MRPVRANATTGFISGNGATAGRRVKPKARRSGLVSSSALQIVGVSQAVRALRLAALGKLGIDGSPWKRAGGKAGAPPYWLPARAARAFRATLLSASSERPPLEGKAHELHRQPF